MLCGRRSETSSSSDDALGRPFTLGRTVQRRVVLKAPRDPDHLRAESAQLRGHRPRAEGARRELHRVNDLKALYAARRADQPDDLVMKI
jgi:hypothetical protein